MNYDGIYIKAQINEIKDLLLNEHISRITERSLKEVDLHIRKNGKNLVLRLSAEPNFPYILLIDSDVENFDNPPAFCMLLRKYLQSGLIIDIKSGNPFYTGNKISLERIVDISIKNINEYGDNNIYHLIIEIMGKYSNIIITDSKYSIIDIMIKSDKNNVRLKTKTQYNIDSICNKKEILDDTETTFNEAIMNYKTLCEINNEKYDIKNAICKIYTGISKNRLFDNINYENLKQIILSELDCKEKNLNTLLKQHLENKSINLNNSTEKKNIDSIIKNIYTKLTKKLDIYKKELSKCDNLNMYKKYGDLIATFGYNKNQIINNILICEDYNDNNAIVKIPLEENLSIAENVNKYYEKYNKLKRTKENAEKLTIDVNNKISHLDSIVSSLSLSNDKYDIFLIKEELIKYFDETNKIQELNKQKKIINNRKLIKNKSRNALNYNIHHYKSSTGVDIYVGKNNLQNEYLTFTLASPDDTWLHIKNATGSHVIIKKPYTILDDETLIEAASIAAYFSDKNGETKATVDYTLRKELKKVKGKAPGFCIYHKNYSINVKPEIKITEIS